MCIFYVAPLLKQLLSKQNAEIQLAHLSWVRDLPTEIIVIFNSVQGERA